MNRSDSRRQRILDAAYSLFRARGFDETSMSDITTQVGGSKATIYGYFGSKERLFVESVISALDDYMAAPLERLGSGESDPAAALRDFGTDVLNFVCSAEQLELRRLMIAQAARSGTGKLFFDKVNSLRARVAAFLAGCMAAGTLRRADPELAAHQLGALLEAEILEPLLLHARKGAPSRKETALAAKRAVEAFLRAYAPGGEAQPAEREARTREDESRRDAAVDE